MSTIVIEMRGTVVNGIECGSIEGAHTVVNRLLGERAGVDPRRCVSLSFRDLFEAKLVETETGALLLLAADTLGQWLRVSEHADIGSARAALVRLVREHGKALAVARFNEALVHLRPPRSVGACRER